MLIKVKNSQSSDNLLNIINEGNILVLYHADWCGYCTEFLPTWKKLINKMKSNNQVHLGEIEHKYLKSFPDPNVKTFPSLKFYKLNEKNKLQKKKNKFL
jgi:thiol-disulfide isomerase/thioredoxin